MRILSLLAALPLLAGSAFGWGCEGHQMVAFIARAHLTPAAEAAVDRLLRENPIDPAQKRFCQDRPADPLAEGAPWADDMKPIDKTYLWHQIDIPMPLSSGDYTKWCDPIGPSVGGKDRPGCIVNAIPYELAILRDPNQSAPERAKALRYVVHLMGDLTQPLHVSDNFDQGGNCTRMKFFAMEALQTLHGIWDYDLIAHDLAEKKETQPQYAAAIDKDFRGHWREWGEAKTDGSLSNIVAWTWEAHKLAFPAVYANLKTQLPLAPVDAGMADRAACDAERNSVEALHISIGDEYAAQAIPVIREQLAKAGYRLAGVLNQTFK